MNKRILLLLTPKTISYILILIGVLFIVLINKFPIKNSFFDFTIIFLLFSIIFFISKKISSSLIIAIYTVNLILFCALLKFDNLKSNLVFEDVYFLRSQPFFLLDYVKNYQLFLLPFIVYLIFYIFKNEQKTRLNNLAKFLFIIIFTLSSYFSYTHLKNNHRIWDWTNKAESQFLLKFISSVFNSINLNDEKNNYKNKFCCGKTKLEDLKAVSSDKNNPNIIFVLLESTINISRIKELNILENPWKKYNSIPLKVFSTGGGTWIAEYSILHGVDPSIYGPHYHHIHLLGPISQLSGRIAPSLQSLGYQTSTISPMEKDFYNSEIFHKSLGIQNFMACEDLKVCKHKNRELVDKIVFTKIIETIKKSKNPAFIFGLTISQHSPHLKTSNTPKLICDSTLNIELCNEFSEYIKREEQLKLNIDNFVSEINSLAEDSIVVFFGDHIASSFSNIPETEATANNPNYETIAFAYESKTKKFVNLKELLSNCYTNFKISVSDLDVLALKQAGIHSPYIDEKIQALQKMCFNY